jgi:hypothetical protein
MIFTHASMIQEGESALFYRFSRPLNGYMIAGLFIAPNMEAKLNFIKKQYSSYDKHKEQAGSTI